MKNLLNSFRNADSAHEAEQLLGQLRFKIAQEETRRRVCAKIEAISTGNECFDHGHLFIEQDK